MNVLTLDIFVKMKTTNTIKLVNHDTGIYETITPTKAEVKLIERKIKEKEKLNLVKSESLNKIIDSIKKRGKLKNV